MSLTNAPSMSFSRELSSSDNFPSLFCQMSGSFPSNPTLFRQNPAPLSKICHLTSLFETSLLQNPVLGVVNTIAPHFPIASPPRLLPFDGNAFYT